QEGRSTLAPGTHRQGVLFAGRARGPFFDVSASATYARARFDAHDSSQLADYVSADAGKSVPFIPNWVARLDGALFKDFEDWKLFGSSVRVRFGCGASYISPRALLFGERGETLVLIDSALTLGVGAFDIGAIVENVFDARYREAEFNYVSEF